MTHTVATLEISKAAFDEIKRLLVAASYEHVICQDGADSHGMLDMTGIGLTRMSDVKEMRLALFTPAELKGLRATDDGVHVLMAQARRKGCDFPDTSEANYFLMMHADK